MKLFYIANIRLPTEKAHGVQITNMCEAFADNGCEVELIVPIRKTHIKEDVYKYYQVKENFKITRLWCLDFVRFGKVGFWLETLSFSGSVLAYTFFKKGLFYTRDEVLAFFLEALNKNVTWEVHMGQENICAKALLRLGTQMVVITQGLKKLYLEYGVQEEKMIVAHDAFNPKEFNDTLLRKEVRQAYNISSDAFVVGYIGKYKTSGQSKGVEDLIEPFKQLLQRYSNSLLLIVGPEISEVGELEIYMHKEGISPTSYRVVSHVPHRMTSHYMRAANLLVLPYPNTLHYARNMSPLKLFSYMGSGTPILASDLPSLREVLTEKSAFFFDPDTQGDLAQKLLYIVEHKEEAESKAKEALLESKELTWSNRAEKILAFISA